MMDDKRKFSAGRRWWKRTCCRWNPTTTSFLRSPSSPRRSALPAASAAVASWCQCWLASAASGAIFWRATPQQSAKPHQLTDAVSGSSVHHAIPLTQATVFGAAVMNLVHNVPKRHPGVHTDRRTDRQREREREREQVQRRVLASSSLSSRAVTAWVFDSAGCGCVRWQTLTGH